MRLLDLIACSVEPVGVQLSDGEIVRLPGASTARSDLEACATRYVLDDEVAALCTQTAFEHESVIGECLDILRLPAPQLWLEFDNVGRAAMLSRAGLATQTKSQRIGILLASPGGRAGTLRFAWQNPAAPDAELAPVFVEFDLDDPCFAQTGDNIETFGVALENLPQLKPLFDRLRFRIDPAWRGYYERVTAHPAHYQRVLQGVIAPLCGDLPILFAFLLLLMTRSALQSRQSDLARLNRSRARVGRSALLNYTEVSLDLTARAPPAVANDSDAHERAHVRLHLVRGHLVRRGNCVFWRTAHMRGAAELGAVTSRTVTLRLAAGATR